MNWSIVDIKLIEAYVVLRLAEIKKEDEVPEKYSEEVEIRVAQKTIEVLEGESNGL